MIDLSANERFLTRLARALGRKFFGDLYAESAYGPQTREAMYDKIQSTDYGAKVSLGTDRRVASTKVMEICYGRESEAGADAEEGQKQAMEAILEAAQDMADVGLIDKKSMRGHERLCAVQEVSAGDVARIRNAVNASQNYFARVLNVSPSTVQQWESGAKKPSGLAMKLLRVVEKHGLALLD